MTCQLCILLGENVCEKDAISAKSQFISKGLFGTLNSSPPLDTPLKLVAGFLAARKCEQRQTYLR